MPVLNHELRELELCIVQRVGSPSEQRMAAAVRGLIKRKHLLLVTLLLCNALAMEALPLVLDRVLPGIAAVVISVTAVLGFGEILPQAFCKAYGLAAGAAAAPLVRCLLVICFPIAWPIAKMLDCLLGHDEGNFYEGEQMAAALEIHKERGHLSTEEAAIMQGALSMARKRSQDGMTPIDRVQSLAADAVLDANTLDWIMRSGYSRIPVHENGQPTTFLGYLLVKKLITLRPEDAWPVSTQRLNPLVMVLEDQPLYKILDVFQTGQTHMALVYPKGTALGSSSAATPLGILTLEDVLEELINEEIVDETDRFIDAAHEERGPAEQVRQLSAGSMSDDGFVFTAPVTFASSAMTRVNLRRQATAPALSQDGKVLRHRLTTMCDLAQSRSGAREASVRTVGRRARLWSQPMEEPDTQESSGESNSTSECCA
ncbi:MAM3 [Symbiodinium sp. KB8]|nr:MAM3 [Symbiodinium sp. KB8]